LKIDLDFCNKNCSPKKLVISNISFMAIFADVTETESIMEKHLRDIHSVENKKGKKTDQNVL